MRRESESHFWAGIKNGVKSGVESGVKSGVESGVGMLLDIEKKLSNLPVPFRSALNGVDALIKHYEVRSFHTTSTCY